MTVGAGSPAETSQVRMDGDRLVRTVQGGGWLLRSFIPATEAPGARKSGAAHGLLGAWWTACLRGAEPSPVSVPLQQVEPLRAVDLFAGAGGMMVGVRQLAAEAGRRVVCELAVDTEADAVAVHARNHRTRRLSSESVTSLVDYRIRGSGASTTFVYPPELLDDELAAACANPDILVAGPPCQGHSNLNNHSRRNDRRNLLYLSVPAFAVACDARAVVIENVAGVVHDEMQVVQTTRALLEAGGYSVTEGVLAADAMGWPQSRRRHFLIARRGQGADPSQPVPISSVQQALADNPPLSVRWAIGGRQDLADDPMLHVGTELTEANRDRIRWLFDNDEHDLALGQRPECHQDGTSYGAVYGRMHADRPAPTITTGYMTPGRGRFVHPTEHRTLTPAEAARLQGFPDDYCFRPAPGRLPSRSQLAKWIGDAVAAPLGYAAALSALAPQIAASPTTEPAPVVPGEPSLIEVREGGPSL